MLLHREVDGMIFISCEMTNLEGDHDHYGRLIEDGARLVFVNGALPDLDVPSIRVDEEAAGELATMHLIELGHRRIGFVAGPAHYLPTRQKAAGREGALRAAGHEPDGLVEHAEFTFAGGRAAMRALLGRSEPPTGVICSSDVMAIGVIQEAVGAGLRVPEDISVVGFDGIDADPLDPSPAHHGRAADRRDRRHGRDRPHVLIEDPDRPLPNFVFRPKLRPGRSTSCPPAV